MGVVSQNRKAKKKCPPRPSQKHRKKKSPHLHDTVGKSPPPPPPLCFKNMPLCFCSGPTTVIICEMQLLRKVFAEIMLQKNPSPPMRIGRESFAPPPSPSINNERSLLNCFNEMSMPHLYEGQSFTSSYL